MKSWDCLPLIWMTNLLSLWGQTVSARWITHLTHPQLDSVNATHLYSESVNSLFWKLLRDVYLDRGKCRVYFPTSLLLRHLESCSHSSAFDLLSKVIQVFPFTLTKILSWNPMLPLKHLSLPFHSIEPWMIRCPFDYYYCLDLSWS